jgi:hypothetical protein
MEGSLETVRGGVMPAEEVKLETDNLAEFIEVVEDWRKDWKVGENALYRGHQACPK